MLETSFLFNEEERIMKSLLETYHRGHIQGARSELSVCVTTSEGTSRLLRSQDRLLFMLQRLLREEFGIQ